jgi:hypothetical protein
MCPLRVGAGKTHSLLLIVRRISIKAAARGVSGIVTGSGSAADSSPKPDRTRILGNSFGVEPTKPTKPGFDGFVGSPSVKSPIIEAFVRQFIHLERASPDVLIPKLSD